MQIIAFPSAVGGAGQSSLVFHLDWMCAELRVPSVEADFDLKARQTSNVQQASRLSETPSPLQG